MKNLSIIGSSKIIEQHLEAAIKSGFILQDICTTNKNSKNIHKYLKKYKFKNTYFNWKKMLEDHKKSKDLRSDYYLIAPRIKDTDIILKSFCNLQKKFLVEKPLSLNSFEIKKYFKFYKNIYVGYNRIFYDSILSLKKKKISNSLVKVFLPEVNRENFKKNSCHILSILIYLFGDLKIISKIKKKNLISASFETKNNNLISLQIYFNASDNFSIKIYDKSETHILKPIENYKYYKNLKKIKLRKDTIYLPKLIHSKNEYKIDKFKPGFFKMWKLFYKSSKRHHPNNINLAYKVMKICEEIIR